ncbi:hypothetical protein DY000_02063684 [Brassica cretica]|uniref:Ubiquitin-like protease family profile domain-containing protein n=1 Tax=Brassica cretica TaxID=69181 RepID=A0ABQ7AN34_BRACR|nr:hypothetical protein DY000_02063684 [Brassica cretica]
MDLTESNLPNHPSIELDAVLQVEVNPSLRVTPLIPVIRGPHHGWGVWPNDKTDDKVTYMEQLRANNHCFTKAMWPGGDCTEPVFTFTPIPEKPVHKKHTVPRKRKESTLKPHKAGKETSVPTDQRRSTRLQASSTPTPRPSNELLEARIYTLEANAAVMVPRITGLEATVAKLGASNECLKQKLHRKRKRNRATSLLPLFVVTHHRRSAPQAPQNNDLPGDDHHDSPNSKRRKTKQLSDGILGSGSPILSQYRAQHCASRRIDFNNPVFTDHLSADHPSADHTYSPHQYPGPHSPLNHSHNQRSTPLLATDHNSFDHQSPNHQTHNHPSPTSCYADHNSSNHDPHPCEALVVDPLDHAPPIHIHPTTTTSYISAPDHNSPLPAFSLAQHSPTMNTSTELSPLFTAATSPKHPLPPAPALSPQGSLSQQYAPIGTLPQFDATPLNKPSSQSSPSHGSTSRLISQDPTNEHGVGEDSDSSPDKTVRRVVDELNAQTSVPEVCELSDSSPARKTKEHHPSEAEKVLAQTFLNRPDFPHYLLVTPPPEDLWVIFAKTMATNKKVFHVTLSKLDFSNQFLLQLATPSQWTDSLHMAVLMHMLDMHHKDVIQMANATFMPPTLTSLMQSKDRQFQAADKKDKIRHWVGLAIDLRAGHVDVLDSLPSLYDEEDVQRFLRPILQMLPYLIRYLVKNNSRDLSPFTYSLPSLYDEEDVQRFLRPILQMLPYLIRYLVKNNSRDLSPFTCQRRTGTYENTRSSVCAPVCAKFMELHLFGDPYPHMSSLTDAMVDKFRQQYAMEAYKTIVLPAYY